MKKFLLTLALVGAVTSAFAQAPTPAPGSSGTAGGTFTFTPLSQSVSPNGSFMVNLSYSGATPPATIGGFDLYLVTSSANSGLFSIATITPTGPFTNLAGTGAPSSFSTSAATDFVRTANDLGLVGPAQTAPYALSLETLTINTNGLTPGVTYTIFSSTFANAGNFYSDVNDGANGDIYEVTQASFSVTAVPEPSTWFAGLGAAGLIGYTMLRRRQTA